MSQVWQSVQLARHAKRPLFLDYVDSLFDEFDELHGDRAFADDRAIIGGLARFNGQPVLVVGQHRGRSTRERIAHNFGMANPEGYRKIIRLVQLAERFGFACVYFYRYSRCVSWCWCRRAGVKLRQSPKVSQYFPV